MTFVGRKKYRDLDAFSSDVQLMFRNCIQFNRDFPFYSDVSCCIVTQLCSAADFWNYSKFTSSYSVTVAWQLNSFILGPLMCLCLSYLVIFFNFWLYLLFPFRLFFLSLFYFLKIFLFFFQCLILSFSFFFFYSLLYSLFLFLLPLLLLWLFIIIIDIIYYYYYYYYC